jgi:outer membrane protein assembly factor BamC
MRSKRLAVIFLSIPALAVFMAACTTGPKPLLVYKSAVTRPSLEVPPGLDQLPTTGPANGATTLSGFKAEQGSTVSADKTVLPEFSRVKLQHGDGQYWLLVREKPDAVWNEVRDFIFNLGLTVSYEDKAAGVLQTDWAENRAKLGHGFVSKMFSAFDSTGTRDRYRFQLVRGGSPGTTEVHVIHQGMQEVTAASDSEGAYRTVWQPAPPDHTIEAEVLRLLMVRMGMGAAASRSEIAASNIAQPRAVLKTGDDQVPQILLREPLKDAWTRVGQTLDRTAGITVADRDATKRVYSIRVSHADDKKKKAGFFGRMFGEKAGPGTDEYRVALASDGNRSVLRLQTKNGKPDKTESGKALLKLLYKQLR